jgi:hypothetical protein
VLRSIFSASAAPAGIPNSKTRANATISATHLDFISLCMLTSYLENRKKQYGGAPSAPLPAPEKS